MSAISLPANTAFSTTSTATNASVKPYPSTPTPEPVATFDRTPATLLVPAGARWSRVVLAGLGEGCRRQDGQSSVA
ncbi:hypothetical protein GCM10010492_02890 [Saccharothrix mutabilis subsp. mutabilis]|uniref:Uncharacterized protein n=1 Tax=Saccharothrix mutabilis subsp. mutabilis TaxID=66855 RepID=A0ABN0T0X7_9PSEU